MDYFKGELDSILNRALKNYTRAVKHNGGKWEKADKLLKNKIDKIIGGKNSRKRAEGL